jgi:hypothetical protein
MRVERLLFARSAHAIQEALLICRGVTEARPPVRAHGKENKLYKPVVAISILLLGKKGSGMLPIADIEAAWRAAYHREIIPSEVQLCVLPFRRLREWVRIDNSEYSGTRNIV